TTTTHAASRPLRPTPKARKSVTAGPFTLVAGGDIAFSGAGASDATFAGIRRFLDGDVVFGNLEGTLATSGTPKCAPYGVNGCYTFRADPASAAALRGLHGHEPGEQPRSRLRRYGPARDDPRGPRGQPRLHGPAGPDRGRGRRRCQGRPDRVRAVSVGPEPARHPG